VSEILVFSDELEHPGIDQLIADRRIHTDQHQSALASLQGHGDNRRSA
jgi:hypothetical protein